MRKALDLAVEPGWAARALPDRRREGHVRSHMVLRWVTTSAVRKHTGPATPCGGAGPGGWIAVHDRRAGATVPYRARCDLITDVARVALDARTAS